MSQSQVFDLLITGGSSAGLSAVYTLARLLHPVVLFDSGIYRSAGSSHMHVVPTWGHKDPKDLRAVSRKNVKVEGLARTGAGLFKAIDTTNTKWPGRKVVLATSARDSRPNASKSRVELLPYCKMSTFNLRHSVIKRCARKST